MHIYISGTEETLLGANETSTRRVTLCDDFYSLKSFCNLVSNI